MLYYANGITHKIEEEEDGWFSIYRWHPDRWDFIPKLQAKTLQKAKDYCDMVELIPVPLRPLVERGEEKR